MAKSKIDKPKRNRRGASARRRGHIYETENRRLTPVFKRVSRNAVI